MHRTNTLEPLRRKAARWTGYAEVGDGGGFDVIGPDIIPALRAFSLLPPRLSFVYQCSHPWGKRDVHTPRGLAGGKKNTLPTRLQLRSGHLVKPGWSSALGIRLAGARLREIGCERPVALRLRLLPVSYTHLRAHETKANL